MIAISIIIPVYNTEKYIAECIESLLNQTLENCEYIFVNDGSKDKSQSIIESYQKNDRRIILINQENQGVSIARNNGIAIAKGEYVGFVDGDDYLENEMYEKLFLSGKQNNVSIVVSEFITEMNGKKVISKPAFQPNIIYNKNFIDENIIPYFIREDSLNSACNKIYKRDLILNNKITFPIHLSFAEDAMFNIKAFNCSESVIFTNHALYNYREVEGSVTRDSLKNDYFKKALNLYNFDYKSAFDLELPNEKITDLKAIRFINTVVSLIHIYFKPNKKSSIRKRYNYVKNMICNENVQRAINKNWKSIIANKNNYNKFILKSIKTKSVLRLFFATKYSNFRN